MLAVGLTLVAHIAGCGAVVPEIRYLSKVGRGDIPRPSLEREGLIV